MTTTKSLPTRGVYGDVVATLIETKSSWGGTDECRRYEVLWKGTNIGTFWIEPQGPEDPLWVELDKKLEKRLRLQSYGGGDPFSFGASLEDALEKINLLGPIIETIAPPSTAQCTVPATFNEARRRLAKARRHVYDLESASDKAAAVHIKHAKLYMRDTDNILKELEERLAEVDDHAS